MKKLSLTGLILFIGGLLIFLVTFTFTGFDLSKLSTMPEYEQKSYVSKTEITSVKIEDNNTEIYFDKSPDNNVHVRYCENDKDYYKITENGELEFKKVSERQWFDKAFSINLNIPSISVLIPENFKGSINIETSNGKIDVKNISTDDFKASTFNGKIEISEVSASGAVKLKSSNGGINIDDVNSQNKITAETSNGKISTDDISAKNEIKLATSNGAIEGSVIGKISDFSITSRTTLGKNNLPNTNGGNKKLTAETSNGSINIEFTEE